MIKIWATLIFLILLRWPDVAYSQPITRQGAVCWPLNIAGVVVGVTNEPQSRRLLGNGIFRKNEGIVGGRYFIDRKRRTTLHLVYGTDAVVEKAVFSDGINVTIRRAELHNAVSKWLDAEETFGNWHALGLGSSKKAALENLGRPKKGYSGDVWTYQASCTCELPEYFILYFKNDHIFKVSLEAPQG